MGLFNITKEQLLYLQDRSPEEAKCLIDFWQSPYPQGVHCNATWDSIYCWPTIPAGEEIAIPCKYFGYGDGTAFAYRYCDDDGLWVGNWTNYTACLQYLENNMVKNVNHHDIVTADVVASITFIGSSLSLLLLTITLFIFCYFKSLQCSRISIHKNLVTSFIIRFVLMLIIIEPFFMGRETSYRSVDWLCKTLMSLHMYTNMASINWMFVEGMFLHNRIAISVFNTHAPFKLFYVIGWGIPTCFIIAWATTMHHYHPYHCWKNYGDVSFIWIITTPMIAVLIINLIFLINIIRILVTKLRAHNTMETAQVRKAIKATAVLFPLLGITNLLFFVNPKDGGSLEKAYLISNAILQSSQGIFVSVIYCFLNSEVQSAIRKKYIRTMIRRHPGTYHHGSFRSDRRKSSRTSSFFLSQFEAYPVSRKSEKHTPSNKSSSLSGSTRSRP